MQLRNQITLDAPLERAWSLLRDLERVAPHVPGADVASIDGGTCAGTLRVKIGTVSATYAGTAEVLECDDQAHRIVVKGSGRDESGRGSGVATLRVEAKADGSGTAVDLGLEVTLVGKFSRTAAEVLSNAAGSLVEQFVASAFGTALRAADAPAPEIAHAASPSDNGVIDTVVIEEVVEVAEPSPVDTPLAEELVEPQPGAPAVPQPEPAPGVPDRAGDRAEPTSVPPAANRVASVLAMVGVASLFLAWLVRRRRRRAS